MSSLIVEQVGLADGSVATVRIDDGIVTGVERGRVPVTNSAAGGANSVGPTPLRVIDGRGKILLTALAEPHAHLDKALSAESVPNRRGDLMGAIEAWRRYVVGATAAEMAERAERCARMMIANGTTAIRSHVDVHSEVGLRAAEALVEVRERLRGRCHIELVALTGWPTADSGGADSRSNRSRRQQALEMGVDLVGGCPHLETDQVGCIEAALTDAADHGVGIDLHVDETLDPAMLSLETLAERVMASGFTGRVTASHCVSLGMNDSDTQRRVAEKVAAAGIAVVALPQTNLYLGARGIDTAPPRGLTAIAALHAAGATLVAGGDNVQDPFNLVGRADALETAALMVMAGHLSPEAAFESVSGGPRSVMGLPRAAVEVGHVADLVLFDADSLRTVVASAPCARTVIFGGTVVAERYVVEVS